MQNVYLFCRKIHRITLFLVIGLGLVMMITGSMMKFGIDFPFMSSFQARVLHNTISVFFTIPLLIMMITGSYMFIHPYVLRRQAKRFPKRF
jgi:hypothetical protein